MRQVPFVSSLVLVVLTLVGPRLAGAAGVPSDSVLGVRCADIYLFGIDRQANLRAGLIREGCGVESSASAMGESREENPGGLSVEDYGGVDIDVSGPDPNPFAVHSTSMVWGNDATVVVTYNDSAEAPNNYSGVSVSFDGGATFTRLRPSPFATGHGENYGYPVVVWNAALQQWFAGFLVTGCGSFGIGLWSSVDALNWRPGACAHAGTFDDRESMWADNNPDSPYFGRMYISWNDFGVSDSPLSVTHSDNGVSWSTPVRITATFIRNVQLSGSPTDGTVVIAGMEEHGGSPTRTNWSYVSTDGGSTWQSTQMGPDFVAPGTPGCGYFWRVAPIWRYMGWGQPAVGPNGVIHYAYAGHGVNPGDLGDIYYVRSVDNGQTWSDPIVLNTDQLLGGTTEQWMPSVSVTAGGDVFVSWYDRRNTTDGSTYEFWGIESPDNGETWLADMAVSDVISAQPTYPDCNAGDYNYHTASGATHFVTWMDGREIVKGQSQQNVLFDQVPAIP